MKKSKIEWTDTTWNPVMGCCKCSPGCDNCYSLDMIERFKGRKGWPKGYLVTMFNERLNEPSRWKNPRVVFVCSMADLFHDGVPERFIWRVMKAILKAPMHKFLVLTKRPERMLDVMSKIGHAPIKNLGLGVTVCNQEEADIKIPLLLRTPAAMRFVSVEPMLGPVDLARIEFSQHNGGPQDYQNVLRGDVSERAKRAGIEKLNTVDWVICGGESGKNARPVHPDWIRTLRDQCVDANTPFFFKQWGEWKPWEEIREVVIGGIPYGYDNHEWENGVEMWKVGKKSAGRELDGRVWDQRTEWFLKKEARDEN